MALTLISSPPKPIPDLAVVGLYGLMSQSVVERTRELGIRLALGACIARAIRDAALRGVSLALAGVAVGCAIAAMSERVLHNLLWGVTATDPLTFSSVALGLVLVAALASIVPALRITRLNPVVRSILCRVGNHGTARAVGEANTLRDE